MTNKEWIIAGNWKMNLDKGQCLELLNGILALKEEVPPNVDLIVAPAFPFLDNAVQKALGSDLLVAAQNCYFEESGAFTGEVSPPMLSSLGVNACIVGHSERRKLFNESDELVSKKVDALLAEGLLPIFCCGEDQEIRAQSGHFEYVGQQVERGLFHLGPERFSNIVIAYEPIWAIGTGQTATPEQAQEMHAHIRNTVKRKFGEELANHLRIIYGGSCKPSNATELFACADVNGGLIGGASLKAEDLIGIARATEGNA